MGNATCPACDSAALLPGSMFAGEGEYSNIRGQFLPKHTRWTALAAAVPLAKGPMLACADCGHVWTKLDPAALRTCVSECGDELLRQHLDGLDRGPLRDLPETDVAREIGEKIATIDAAAIEGGTAVVRLYRELAGLTWDEAFRDTKRWRHLTRGEKLELFGWVPKKKAAVDDLA